jgi:DNA-binding CsgD family transcriptional regulator
VSRTSGDAVAELREMSYTINALVKSTVTIREPDMAKTSAKKKPVNLYQMDPAHAKKLVASLTPREKQTAERIAMGVPQAQIAKELGISPKTLDIFRGKVKKKLGTTMHGIPRVWFCALAAK